MLLGRRRPAGSTPDGRPSRRERRDVFVSYAREDVEFVRRLHERLREAGRTAYVDFSDIPAWSEDWQRDLYAQIDASDTVVVVVSPDSLASPNVAREVERAAAQRKRLRPLQLRDVDGSRIPPAIGKPQWSDFRDPAAFEDSFAGLVDVLETDVEWVQRHTRFLLAAEDWQARGEDPSLLLGRSDLRDAEAWLAGQAGKEPPPTDLQVRYVLASRSAATRRQRRTLGAVVAALVVTAALAVFSLVQRDEAIEQRDQARSRELAALSAAQLEVDPEESLSLALRSADTARTSQAEAALQAALAQSLVRLALDTQGTGRSPMLDSAVTPDGRLAVTVHRDGPGQVWDLRTGRRVSVLSGHTAPVTSVDISADGRRAITASRVMSSQQSDGVARLWDLPSGRLVAQLEHEADGISTAVFSPDGRRILTTTDADSFDPATVWDAARGRRVLELGEEGDASFAAWSPDGRQIVTVGAAVAVWDAASGKRVRTIRLGPDDFPSEAAFSPDGRTLAVAGEGAGYVVDLARGTRTRLPLSALLFNGLTSVRFCPDGSCLLTGSEDDTARLWTRAGRERFTLRGHTADVGDARVSPDGRYILTESDDGTARLWSRKTGAQLAVLRGHDAEVTGAHFLGGGTRIFTSSVDGTGRVWDPELVLLDGHSSFVADGRFSPDGSSVLTASSDSTAKVWSRGGTLLRTLRPDDASGMEAAMFSPDGRHVLTEQDSVSLWRASGELVRSFDFGVDYPAFSPDSRLVAAAADVDAVLLFDPGTGREVGRLPVGPPGGRRTAVFRPSFTPDASVVAAPGALTGAHVWDLRARGRSVDLRGDELIEDVAFSPDGRQLATYGDSTRSVRLWDVDARTSVVLDRYPTGVRALAYSPDGRLIATVSAGERAVRVHDARSRELVAMLRHENDAFDASFDPTGRLVLTVSNDVRAHLWEARTGRLVATLGGHTDTISSARFSPDGRAIVTASDDGTALVRRCDACLPYEELRDRAARRVTSLVADG